MVVRSASVAPLVLLQGILGGLTILACARTGPWGGALVFAALQVLSVPAYLLLVARSEGRRFEMPEQRIEPRAPEAARPERSSAVIEQDTEDARGPPVGSLGARGALCAAADASITTLGAAGRDPATARAGTRFLAFMSHELRTPLNAILNMNELLLESGLDEEQRGYAVTVGDSARALLSMVTGVLDFSKIEAGSVEPCPRPSDPEAIVKSVVELLAARASSSDVPLTVYTDPSLPSEIETDPGLVRQIVMNLIGNAIKFTDDGAVRVRLGLSVNRDATLIEVLDTGIGIAGDRQEELFQEFVQGDSTETRRYGGSGLGLAISRRLARLLGGDIEVRSAPGEGSCFTLRLPLPAPVAEGSGVRAEQAAPLRAWRLSLWHENSLLASDLAEQLGAFGLDVEVLAPLTRAVGVSGEIGLAPRTDGDRARGPRRSRRVALYPLGGAYPADLGQPGRAIAALRLPVVASDLIRRLVDASVATAPIKETDSGEDLIERVARCAATAPPILLAEDSRPNQLVVTTILRRVGFRVDLAENGLQAVAAVNRTRYGVVLMDVAMPDMDGIEATGCIRALPGKRGRVPIIAMTANAFDEDRRRCLDAGMDDYLSKPVERRALYEALLRSLEGVIPAERQAAGLSARPIAALPPFAGTVTGGESPSGNRPTQPVEEILDEAALDALRADLSDELLPEVIGAFVAEVARRIRSIARAAADGDAALAGREGHALKGSASQFGAAALHQTASAIEKAGSSGSIGAVRDQLETLQARGDAAIAALRERFRVDDGGVD